MERPEISVVVATRDRGDRVVGTIRTILDNDAASFELIVVDQSRDDTTEKAVQPMQTDSRLRYLRSSTSGLSVARNQGIAQARADVIALTDDDCEVSRDWLSQLHAAFTADARLGVVFGNVLPGNHDPEDGFIPSYVIERPYRAATIHEKHRVEGIGACMGLRREVWQAVGGFDERLGAGAPFKSAEELDLTIRALRAGYGILETPTVAVTHLGFRRWDEAAELISGHLYGIGAMFGKHLKCRNFSILALMARLMWRWAFDRPVVDFGHRPSRWLRLAAFARGFRRGVASRVSRQHITFA